jgi:hypothetical protein
MYLAWEALSKFVPDLYIGAFTLLFSLSERFCICCRYDGICLHVSCRLVACWHPRWRIRPLSHHQHRYARTRRGSQHDLRQFEHNLIFYGSKPRQANVSLFWHLASQTLDEGPLQVLSFIHVSLCSRSSSLVVPDGQLVLDKKSC